jgi:hypothetical protein
MARQVIPGYVVLRVGPVSPPDPEQLRRFADLDGPPREADPTHVPGARAMTAAAATRNPLWVSLRWALNPAIGFPRAPFQVWRRARKEEPTTQVAGSQPRTAPTTVTLSSQVIEVRFRAEPQPGRTLVVEALASNGHVLPGQRLSFTTTTDGRFRAPGISRLRMRGVGKVTDIGGIEQTAYANLPDWALVDVVGLPFRKDEIGAPDYEPVPQGRAAPSLDGVDAALFRLKGGRLLQRDPPAPGAGLATPVWPFPDPERFLEVLRKGPLADVSECLRNSDDADPLRIQALYKPTRTLAGIHQPGISTPTTDADLSLATTQYVGLAVNDSPVALGLGFGTFDVTNATVWGVKDRLPPGTFIASVDYMVTATVTLAFGFKLELAAIGFIQPPPAALGQLQATQTFANRPLTRDTEGSAAVLLSWAPPREPIGTGILLQRGGSDAIVNVERPDGAGGFQPYLMPHKIGPNGEPAGDERPGVTMPEEPAPVSGSSVTTYAAAPIDGHGRWGPWELTNHALVADPVQKPVLNDVRLTLPSALPVSGPVVPGATLEVDVSWDWADRSPDRIEVSGRFVPLGPPPVSVSGFQTGSTGAVGSFVVTIGFSAAGVPSVRVPTSPAAAVTVAQASSVVEAADPNSPTGTGPPSGSASSQVRRYRLRVPVMSLSFATSTQLAFAVSAQAAEKVRPSELSPPVEPRATTVSNPFPAPPPAIPAVTVLWTAQPDASGRARTVLSWPSVPGASGYVVWEATETALYDAVDGTAPPVGQTVRARAIDLKGKIMANQAESLGTFSRLNERPIQSTSMELTLPGSADTLFVYRLSSITAQNIESARSTEIVLVGVPRLERPGTPHLEARYDPATGHAVLTVVPGAGAAPHKLAVHRVRRSYLAQVIDTMGPALATATVSTLTPVAVPVLGGAPPSSGYRIADVVEPSWVPYLYRVVAHGRDLPDDGIRAGASGASGVATVVAPPPLPPALSALTVTRDATATLLRFSTDLPAKPTPAGAASIVVAGVDGSGGRTVLATFDPTAIAEGPALTLPGTAVVPVASRRAPVAGTFEVTALVPPTTAAIVVTATDPLGRSTATEGT